jgi:gamma-glutamyltranspeptidase
MRGAIAAGHPLTAAAGADVLRAGGTAVDACVAAAVVSWVGESMLTGPGGGFMLVHEAAAARTRLLDFFLAVPRERAGAEELLALTVDFDGAAWRPRWCSSGAGRDSSSAPPAASGFAGRSFRSWRMRSGRA